MRETVSGVVLKSSVDQPGYTYQVRDRQRAPAIHLHHTLDFARGSQLRVFLRGGGLRENSHAQLHVAGRSKLTESRSLTFD